MKLTTLPARRPECTCLRLEGDCDLYVVPTLYQQLEGWLAPGRSLHLEFGAVAYLDSSGVGLLIRLLQTARDRRASLSLSGLSGAPRKVLTMANLLAILPERPLAEVAQ